MKIQFIVCGWWYDEFDDKKGVTDFIEELNYLKNENDHIDVFYSCHKEPPKIIKDNFEWKLFENIGLEWGAYDQACRYLDLDKDTFIFFIQDDMFVKDWSFINKCVDVLNEGKVKVIGNGVTYPMNLDPSSEARLSYWLKTKDRWIDYVREENKWRYDTSMFTLGVRGSFFATKKEHFDEIGGFDYVQTPITYGVKEDGRKFLLTDPFGNTTMYLNSYKFTKFLGQNSIRYLSKIFRDSEWMLECGRGQSLLEELDGKHKTDFENFPEELILK